MKRILIGGLIFTSIIFAGVNTSASTKLDKIVSEMPGVSVEELKESIKEASISLGISEDEVMNKITDELKVQDSLSKKEKEERSAKRNFRSISMRMGNRGDSNKTAYTLDAARNVGDIFYEPASTAFVKHGHVGMYYTTDTIVESMPKDGVRSMSRLNKKVENGAKIFTLDGVSQDIKNKAAVWAWGQKGQKYSYNFATNRLTSLTGDKNCSKLVWSAYKSAGNLDIDSDGGLGVYPNDILNYKSSRIYKVY